MRKLKDWLRRIDVYWYTIAGIFAVIVFLNALLTDGTEESPSGVAGWSAGMLAMSVAAIVIVEAAYSGSIAVKRWPGVFLGVVAMASAYLWVAAESEVHPANPGLFAGTIGFWLTCALLAIVVLVFRLGARRGPKDPPEDDK